MIASGMVQYHAALEADMVPIDSVEPHPDNYNNGDLEEITTSIEINGMYRAIYAQTSTRYIIAGNHAWMACKMLGAQVAPIKFLDVDDMTAMRIMIADNEIARASIPDASSLLHILETLADNDSLIGSGKKPHDIEVLRNLAQIPVEYDEFGTWPTLSFTVPPHVKRAFKTMTNGAGDDRERFELLLRLAGWDGKG